MPQQRGGERTIGALGAFVLAIGMAAIVGLGSILRRSRAESVMMLSEPEFYARLGWCVVVCFAFFWLWGGPRQPK